MQKSYHVFKEDEMKIMYDIKSGNFIEIKCAVKDYDIFYETNLKNIPEKRDSFACEGKRLGRISFVTTECCNLSCKYCFAESGTYHSTERKVMSVDTMKKSFEYVCSKYENGVNLVHFFGGEPMLGYESIREFIMWCNRYCKENGIVAPNYSIVTNGTIMNENMFDFLNAYKVNLVVSIDGTKELNDYARVSNTFKSVYDKIYENFKNLPVERNFKIGCEITLNHIHILKFKKGIVREWLDELCSIGFNYATIGVAETPVQECHISADEKEILQSIEKEIIDYFFQRYRSSNDFISVEIMSLIRQMAQKGKSLTCGAGYHSISVMPDGKILPCYQFYHDDNFVMGDINGGNSECFEEIRELFKKDYMADIKECRDCWLRNQCTVHCKGFSYNSTGKLDSIAKTRCWLVEAAMQRLMFNILKLKKEKEEYNNFVINLYALNKEYSYNK